jgi:hypothetical protein
MVREDLLTKPLEDFFVDRVFGSGRKTMLAAAEAIGGREGREALASHRVTLAAQLEDLQRRQDNLISQLEKLEPPGDDDADTALRSGIKNRFATIIAEQRTVKGQLASAASEARDAEPIDISILDQLPLSAINLSRLSEDDMRALYDVFQLELRYNPHRQDLVIRITRTGEQLRN